MDEKPLNEIQLAKDVARFEADLEPLLIAVTLGDLKEPFEIPIYKGSKLANLQAIMRMLVDGFYEQWLEMKAVQDNLEKSNRKLETALERLEQFTYVASHELRGPLVNLKELFELNKKKESLDLEEKMEASIKHFNAVLNELIMAISGSRLPLSRKTFSLKDCINNSFNEFVLTEFPSAELQISGADCNIYNDETLLKRVCQQIMSNTVKFKQLDEKISIKIDIEPQRHGVCLHYSDNSLGIDLPENNEVVFGFFRTGNHVNSGRGIGMYLAKDTIESLGGKIEAESRRGVGMRYKITLEKSEKRNFIN